MTFDEALDIVLRWEGGYCDDPRDPGGATNMGITHRTLADWRGAPVTKLDVENLTRAEAAAIYAGRYWARVRAAELTPGLDLMVFDAAVNQGPSRAVQFLQRAVGVKPDGIFGPATLAAASRWAQTDPIGSIKEVAAYRAVHYAALDKAFHLGWYRRLVDVLDCAIRSRKTPD